MHLPILDINIPGNAMETFEIIVPIIAYDMLSEYDEY